MQLGRDYCQRRAWADAHRAFCRAEQAAPLAGDDLERLALSAYLLGRDDEYLSTLDRAYAAHVAAGESRRAARCAAWLALRYLLRGETGRAGGWLTRGQHLIDSEPGDCVEHGHVLLAVVQQHVVANELVAAQAAAIRAAGIGDHFDERDLSACGRHLQGRVLIERGRVTEGLGLLDESMLAVTAGEVSPIMTGLIYCSVIDACQQVYALGRAREWTKALAHWCAEQTEMVAFTGVCSVHRAEIMQLHGAWTDAIREAERAGERCLRAMNRQGAAAAFYQQAETLRLQGQLDAAERAYQSASQWGWDPQPGLSLLRLAQRRTDAAVAAIRRVVDAATGESDRARLLPACVEIMLAAGETAAARDACHELEEIAQRFGSDVLGAIAAQGRGAIELADGNAVAALGALRRAGRFWQEGETPYALGRVRELVALACRALGDGDGYALELAAARAAFVQLGARLDVERIETIAKDGQAGRGAHGLTPREMQVLRLIAAGKTNKAIAAELFLSAKTIDRHVSNIFSKLNVPSRTAATAYAYQHQLV